MSNSAKKNILKIKIKKLQYNKEKVLASGTKIKMPFNNKEMRYYKTSIMPILLYDVQV